MVTVLLMALGLAAPCEEAIEAATLEARAVEAEQAWADMESERFVEQATALREQLPCVTDALYPAQVAAWFRVQGMLHFYEGDRDQALADLRAALANDPDWRLAPDLAGADHPLRVLIEQAPSDTTGWQPLEAPADGWIRIDGAASGRAPVDRPWVFQRFSSDGQLVETLRVDRGTAAPAYEAQSTRTTTVDVRRIRRLWRSQTLGLIGAWTGPVLLLGGITAQSRPRGGETWLVLGGVGVLGMLGGVPLANLSVSQERRMLVDQGLDLGTKATTVSLVSYTAGVLFFASGFPTEVPALLLASGPCYLASVLAVGAASAENRRAARGLLERPRARLTPLPVRAGAGVSVEVSGW